MSRLHIIGRKNSGKTTLIVQLVEHLTEAGLRVATIKHTHHRHELDTPGKDSHRHRQAGAAAVGILSPAMNAIFWPASSDEDLSDRYDRLMAAMADCDLVLVEGHWQTTAPKIEVWRAGCGSPPLALEDPAILYVVSDDEPDVPVPVMPRSDLAGLADWIVGVAAAP